MGLIKSSWFLLVLIISVKSEFDDYKTTVWSFREDNKNNVNVKAEYIGQEFIEPLGDFSLCFRYKVLYFNSDANGIRVISAENQFESFELFLFNSQSPNLISISNKEGKFQTFWFNAQVPLRYVAF